MVNKRDLLAPFVIECDNIDQTCNVLAVLRGMGFSLGGYENDLLKARYEGNIVEFINRRGEYYHPKQTAPGDRIYMYRDIGAAPDLYERYHADEILGEEIIGNPVEDFYKW